MYKSFLLAFTFGIRAPEGVGQYMLETINMRMILDVGSYFVSVVLLRNIFFGIIINAFSEIRSTKEEREDHNANRCFVCGINRHDFDKQSMDKCTFKNHREKTHNILNYLYFLIRLWEQPQHRDNGLEIHVRQCVQLSDISWFPIGEIGLEEKKNGSSSAKPDVNEIDVEHIVMEGKNNVVSNRKNTEFNNLVNDKIISIEDKLLSLNSTTNNKFKVEHTETSSIDTIKDVVKVSVANKTDSLRASLYSMKQNMRFLSSTLNEIESVQPQPLKGLRRKKTQETSQSLGSGTLQRNPSISRSGPSLSILEKKMHK
jgi:hypothetical protein